MWHAQKTGKSHLEVCLTLSSTRANASVSTSIVQSFKSSCEKHVNKHSFTARKQNIREAQAYAQNTKAFSFEKVEYKFLTNVL